ncbi:TadE/TadG family type IV pilus assembly protein [Pseudomonas sp. Irchel 3A18]|uniref:TadE/TadG family type IV pilus assembly protein n=1 Tax=Pseudomonas sp. Irchel 3A18 TaxID=2008905 RepID=UPI000BA48AC0|nr:TadE/TadG family type IV pilus assembly protein [Pseudomonas sp. Irchel 3A18]
MLNRRLQRGNVAPFMILATGGLLLASAYAIDVTRMTGNASQLKRATDAAALAVGRANADGDENVSKDPTGFATAYVRQNLGMDAQLLDNLGEVTVEEGRSADSNPTYRVTATSRHDPQVSGNASQDLTVHSTAELISKPLEVALAIDSSVNFASIFSGISPDAQLHMDATEHFLGELFGQDSNGNTREEKENLRVAIIPFSNDVNLYDPDHSRNSQPRLKEWTTPDALTTEDPIPSLRTRGFYRQYGDLSNIMFPDRRARRQSFYRGDNYRDKTYDWIASPAESRMRLNANMMYLNPEDNRPVVSERRMFSLSTVDADGADQTIMTDHTIPNAPLLPLEASRSKIETRVREIRGDWQIHPLPGLVWAGSTLSPNWRGGNGWGDSTYPLDFNADGSGPNRKAIVLLMNWNAGSAWREEKETLRNYLDTCQSFSDNGIVFYAVVRNTTDINSPGGHYVTPADWLNPCTGGGQRLHVIEGNSSDTPGDLKAAFDSIANELKSQANRVLLVE